MDKVYAGYVCFNGYVLKQHEADRINAANERVNKWRESGREAPEEVLQHNWATFMAIANFGVTYAE